MEGGYEKPRMEVIVLCCDDVVATSCNGQDFGQGSECEGDLPA